MYVDKRHPKDIMRSISHELVHHRQNCDGEFNRGRFRSRRRDMLNETKHLNEMERQAYEVGNMCFRQWEDNFKMNNNPLQRKEERDYIINC